MLSYKVPAVESLLIALIALTTSPIAEAHVLGVYMTLPFVLTPEGSVATREGEGTYEASEM